MTIHHIYSFIFIISNYSFMFSNRRVRIRNCFEVFILNIFFSVIIINRQHLSFCLNCNMLIQHITTDTTLNIESSLSNRGNLYFHSYHIIVRIKMHAPFQRIRTLETCKIFRIRTNRILGEFASKPFDRSIV